MRIMAKTLSAMKIDTNMVVLQKNVHLCPCERGVCDWPTLQPDLSNVSTYSGFLSNK